MDAIAQPVASPVHWEPNGLVAARTAGGYISRLRERNAADYTVQALAARGIQIAASKDKAHPFALLRESTRTTCRPRQAAKLCLAVFDESVKAEFGERGLVETAAEIKTWTRLLEWVVNSTYLQAPIGQRVADWIAEHLERGTIDDVILRADITDKLSVAVPAPLPQLGRVLTQALINAGYGAVDRQVAPSTRNNLTKRGRAVVGIRWRTVPIVPEEKPPFPTSIFQ